MAGRVDAIDPGLSRERMVSRRAGGTAGCANRAAVEGESLSALIAVIKFENLPDPPPTKILRLRISNRSWAYSHSIATRPSGLFPGTLGSSVVARSFFFLNHTFNREARDLN